MGRRLYVGRLPSDARSEDVSKFFDGYGRIVDCRVMTGFGFVEFETSKASRAFFDAEEAVAQFNGKTFMGANIVVEFAKEGRTRREPYEERHGAGARARRPPGIRIIVSGLSRDTSWQDLKDFGRDSGNVSFADIDRDVPGQGILEYLSRDDAERAVKELDGKDLRGRSVRVDLDESRSGPDNYRRDDRREYRDDYRDRYREDKYRERDREDRYRRDRSKSPRRSEYDDRRAKSPRRDDDRKPSGYDDYRRGGDDYRRAPDYYDRRRDDSDRRRDDRRRDDKEERFDDRPRHSNGEASYR
ncbi:hypothetical protein GYMLUDRAFT_171325 [Collybiopsis luxurians FD-317 M1]|uniref:RRM domain-containing protein n=1 Tax=Collybiopsis luxurians FD-317 M1 TaxID=944289 RepID=A0A0D0C6P8_9AGAR|nr:hypothetical protein GYMLUDRAFT_171325 [Collybiopsis luxurians FD-317 M1]